jgi:hypothetical protein
MNTNGSHILGTGQEELELTAPGYFFDGPLACEAFPV